MTQIHSMRRAGFTLVEMLCAMAILAVIAIGMTMLFADSNRIWQIGTERAENCTGGRAALDMIAHDLQYAVADSILTFVIQPDRYGLASYGFTNSEACFVSIQNSSSDENRAARAMHYWVSSNSASGRFELMRGYYSESISGADYANHCYWNPNWYRRPSEGGQGRPPHAMIADNVAGLAFYASFYEPTSSGWRVLDQYDSRWYGTNRLPEYVDIYLELLNDSDAEQITAMKADGVPYLEFLERRVRRYTTRVFFHNRYGYKDR